MGDLFFILVVLAVLLAFVTVIGHGLWLLIAFLLKPTESPETLKTTPREGESCPRCLTVFRSAEPTCSVCNWPAGLPIGDRRASAVFAVRRQLYLYHQLGLVGIESFQRLVAALDEAARPTATTATATTDPHPNETATAEASDIPLADVAPADFVTPDVVTAELADAELVDAAIASTPLSEKTATHAEPKTDRPLNPPSSILNPPAAPAAPRPALGKLLSAFLEEKNIRWGELVGGLLIVGCSIALVISFWAEIAQRPVLKFSLFNGVSAALFAVGLYTHRRWKLDTTSRGLLIVAMLLLPLNFLAIAAFTSQSPPTDTLSLGGEAASLLLFAILSYFAARVLTPDAPHLLAAGVMFPSVMQLLARRYGDADMTVSLLYTLAAAPIICYAATVSGAIRRVAEGSRIEDRGWRAGDGNAADSSKTSDHDAPQSSILHPQSSLLTEQRANRLFILLGLATFSTLLPLGLLIFKTEALWPTLRQLAPLAVLAGIPAVGVGLLFLKSRVPQSLVREQTAGIAIGVLGAAIMVSSLVLAWPHPQLLFVSSLATATAFLFIALRFAIPQAHLVVGVCGSVWALVVYNVASGAIAWNAGFTAPLSSVMLSATSGNVLAVVCAAYLLFAYLLREADRHDALWWLVAASITALASLAFVTAFGFGRDGDPHSVTWTYAFFAIALAAASLKLDHRSIVWAASPMLLVALVQGVVFRYGDTWQLTAPWTTAVMLHATVATAIAAIAAYSSRRRAPNARRAWCTSAEITSIIAVATLTFQVIFLPWTITATYFAWLAVVWLALAVIVREPVLFTAFHAALAFSLVCFVTTFLTDRVWYLVADFPWLDPWFLQTQGIALAGYCLVWIALRLSLKRSQLVAPSGRTLHKILNPLYPAFDRLCELLLLAMLAALSVYAAAPYVAQELAPLDRPGLATRIVPPVEYALDFMPLDHAASNGAWLLLAAVAVVLVVGCWESLPRWRGLGLLFVAATICALVASRWAADVSVASALRWSIAGFAIAASLPLWLRNSVQQSLRKLGINFGANNEGSLWPNTKSAFGAIVSIYIGTHLAMVAYVAIAVVEKSGVPTDLLALLQGLVVLAIAVVLIVALVKLAERTSTASRADVVDAIVVDRSQESGEIRHATPTSSAYLLTLGSPDISLSLALSHWQTLALFLGIGPLFVTYAFLVASALRQHPLVGPEPDAWFRTIGWSVSYGVPLVVFAITLLGHAIRERSGRIAFAASLLFNLIGTVVFLLELAKAQRPLGGSAWIEVAQVNAIVAALMALGWLAAVRWSRRAANFSSASANDALDPLAPIEHTSIEHARPIANRPLPRLLTTQVVIAAALWILATLPAVVGLIIKPSVWSWVAAAGGPIGWAAAALTFAALGLWAASEARDPQQQLAAFLIRCAIPVAVVLAALVGAYHDTGNWLGYHTLLAGTTLGTWLLAIAPRWFADDARRTPIRARTSSVFNRYVVANSHSSVLNSVFAVAATLLALRALDGDPQSPWWTLAALLSTTLSSIYLAWTNATRGHLWFAGILLPLAATIWWDEIGSDLIVAATVPAVLTHFLCVNVIAAAAMAVVSAIVERQRFVPSKVATELPPVGFHRCASWACLSVMFVAVWIGLTQDLYLIPVDADLPLNIAALVATAIAIVACSTDTATKFLVARLWLVGLLGALTYLDARNLHDDPFIIALAPLLGAYALVSSIAWSLRTTIAQGFRIEDRGSRIEGIQDSRDLVPQSSIFHPPSSAPGHAWLLFANGALTLLVVALSYWIDLSIVDANLRTGAALAILATALSIALLAEGAFRASAQFAALMLGVLFAIALGWARLPLSIEAGILHRAVAAAVAMAAVIPVYALVLGKLAPAASHWPRTAQRVVPFVTFIASLVLIGILSLEVMYFTVDRIVPMRWPAMVAVLAALVTLAIAALAAAVLPGRDPLSLSERGRTVYVYAAEILLALAFLHIRVTMPWLFSGWFTRFWPLVIVAIAFLGVGFAELCRRKRLPVLSEPLENTGALLPLLPTVAFWTYPSQVNYSLLLLSVAALYSVLCLLRKSFWSAMLAALSANGSLWYWLYRTEGLGLEQHPQLWLIPPAVGVLAAAQWNRRRLSDDQMTAIRYFSAIVVYASSTADVFINGVGEAPWLPVALAGLSIVGIFAGILLQVRAFLYLGTSFLLVALFTVIWHAAVEQERTWIWLVTGIVAGILIIALFGLFEKKRDDMLRLVDKIRHWE